MNDLPLSAFPSFGLHLGSGTAEADYLAQAAQALRIDWSCVFGGDVRLNGQEWSSQQAGNRLVDAGGDWLLIVPVSAIPDAFQPIREGFLGPVGHERIALAAWLLLASLPCSGLPDVLLVASGVGSNMAPARDSSRETLWSWPRSYRFATGFFDPTGCHSGGNEDFAKAVGLSGGVASPSWLTSLRLPCACAALGHPDGTDAATLTWQNIGAAAAKLCEVANALEGAVWPRAESGCIPNWQMEEVIPEAEQTEAQAGVRQAQSDLPSWMVPAADGAISENQTAELRAWMGN